ncbi:MAG TPA: YceI family protein, partial [Bacteroidia bacterium]
MKKIIYGIAATGLIALTAFTTKDEIYKVDTKLSSMDWTGKKLTGEHTGTIMFTSGEISMAKEEVTGGTFEIDMHSIADMDIKDENWKKKLEGHLKSADFFDAEKFPKSKFVITSVTPIPAAKEGDFTHHVKGNLTMKDKTNPIEFD